MRKFLTYIILGFYGMHNAKCHITQCFHLHYIYYLCIVICERTSHMANKWPVWCSVLVSIVAILVNFLPKMTGKRCINNDLKPFSHDLYLCGWDCISYFLTTCSESTLWFGGWAFQRDVSKFQICHQHSHRAENCTTGYSLYWSAWLLGIFLISKINIMKCINCSTNIINASGVMLFFIIIQNPTISEYFKTSVVW